MLWTFRRMFLVASVLTATPAAALPLAVPVLPDIVARGSAVLVARPDPDRVLPVSILLPLSHAEALADTVRHLTDPHDPQFRHWLGVAAFADRFGPSRTTYEAVRSALSGSGIVAEARSPSRLVIDAHGRIGDLERALHVRFGLYRHPNEARLFLSADREPTPDFGAAVLAIEGLDDYERPVPHLVQAPARAGATGSGPDGQFTGIDVRKAAYGNGPLTGAGQSVGVFEFGAYDPADVAAYFRRVHAPETVPIVNVALNGIDVTCGAGCHDAEQALDIEEAISMAPGLDSLVYYGGNNPLSIMARMASDDICAVLSVSWGWHPNPAVDEPVLEEMAAQGQSFLVASGDYGFHLAEGAVWPADDTWSIAVGGTDLATEGPGGPWRAERGWHYSGGGPSPNGIPAPSWQLAFVTAANAGSTTARNVPDIAADANTDNFSCYGGHCSGGNGGTSYAAPLWAGFVALANEQAARAGQPSIGFFTPALYASASPAAPPLVLLHDQTKGTNGRYHAVPGFDLVTGLGSPFGMLTIDALVR